MKPLLIALTMLATPASAQCSLTLDILTGADHGTLSEHTALTAEITYSVTEEMRMGSEARAYRTDGAATITGPDGTGLSARLGFIHVVRAAHWADYVSFDMTDVGGDLGGITSYEDPMLITFYAERGTLDSFDLPESPQDWAQFTQRQSFQVHTPDTMWTLPGVVSAPESTCTD